MLRTAFSSLKRSSGVPTRLFHASGSKSAEAGTSAAGSSTKLTLNFFVPHQVICKSKPVDQVIVPGTEGVFGIVANHVPTVAELRPGVVSIIDGATTKKYFVSSGFALVHKDRTDVIAVEAVSVEDIDPEAVRKGLADYTTALSAATNDGDRARAQIGVEVYGAMTTAL
mmetsp:Transcript_27848/g.45236  ORF Transcript_27848/g.45236 Transcript_27848/m.45236 type:complete len:169 (-) Transcript_27848:343-849(-)